MIMMMTWVLMGEGVGAAEYEVGGEKGWVVGAVNYSLWAANYTFFVGDFLGTSHAFILLEFMFKFYYLVAHKKF